MLGWTKSIFFLAFFAVSAQLMSLFSGDGLFGFTSSSQATRTTTTTTTPVVVKEYRDQYTEKMDEASLTRSIDHQTKFMERRHNISSVFPAEVRYQAKVSNFGAVPVSDDYAFLHIWKCGGTTISSLKANDQRELLDKDIQKRKWFGLVRDPIDRYLSAWAECGMRLHNGEITFDFESPLAWLDKEYDVRVRSWLPEVKKFRPPYELCHTHAFPQANYMVDEDGNVDSHMAFVGDLSELWGNLKVAAMGAVPSGLSIGRDSSMDKTKKKYFESRRDLLSGETLIELCEFYAMDYYLFDFDPPSRLRQV
eukprot:Nitzschia sp. Nitz4//scaffold69_size99277//69203//70172//NITZ4_004641-RA/size99277-processed-gene-0.65-mRNA-1//1//CDS//3329556739//2998//frame0